MTAEPNTHACCPSPLNPVARFNDAFRQNLVGGRLIATAGVIALGDRALPVILLAVQVFADFNADNDPHGEHDFGTLTYGDARLFWKIDYYDREMRFGSPDPADPDVTTRVLTIMLAEEY